MLSVSCYSVLHSLLCRLLLFCPLFCLSSSSPSSSASPFIIDLTLTLTGFQLFLSIDCSVKDSALYLSW